MTNCTQKVYVVGESSYSLEYRQECDPALVSARKNKVTLPFTKCNQIFKGPSKFLDPVAQVFFDQSSNILNKQDLEKSQATMDCSQIMQRPSNSSTARDVEGQRGRNAQRQHSLFGARSANRQSQSINSCKTDNHDLLARSNIIPRPNSDVKQSRMGYSDLLSKESQSIGFEADLIEVVSENEVENEDVTELRRVLASKDRQIAELKSQIRKGNTREQILKNKLKIIQRVANYPNKEDNFATQKELACQLQATSSALHQINTLF